MANLKNLYMRKLKRDIALFILVSIFLVASETWLFKGDVFLKKLEFAIRLVIPVMLVIFFRKYTITHKGKVLLVLYGILSLYMLFMVIFSENPNLVALNTVKYLYILAFSVALLLILSPSNFSYCFLYIPVYLGLFFSIQMIILFVLVQTGNPPPSYIVTLVGYKNMDVLSYGLWGYAHGVAAMGTPLQVYRSQSFFGEPTMLASFLEVSTILSFGLYKIKKDKKMLLISIICLICIILTFSMTAYIVIFLILIFCYFIKYLKKTPRLILSIVIVMIPLAVFFIVTYLNVATSDNFYGKSILGFAFGHSRNEIIFRWDSINNSLRLFRDYPFGIGFIGIEDSNILKNYPDAGGRIAPMVWLGYAGIVGFASQLTIIFYLLNNIIIKRVMIYNKIEQYISISLIACILHHCVAGDWFSSIFFYLLICTIATDAHQFSFIKNNR